MTAPFAPSTTPVRQRTRVSKKSTNIISDAAPPASTFSHLGSGRFSIVYRPITALVRNPRNARQHPKKQIQQLAFSVQEFGFINPIVVDENGMILAGHGRYEAALKLGLTDVPTIVARHLTKAQRRAYVIADNKIALQADWDTEILCVEFAELEALDLGFSIEVTGFSTAEIDTMAEVSNATIDKIDKEKGGALDLRTVAVSVTGDLWQLDHHRLICGDARNRLVYERLLAGERAHIVIADPPYNVPIDGYVGGLGQHRHREFAMASGEMQPVQFVAFLTDTLRPLQEFSVDGSLHYLFMDKKHALEILTAGAAVYDKHLDILIWNKTNAGMGSLYRSQHEMIFLFKNGTAPHVNNIQLGATGRYRTNVLTYAGSNTFRPGRDDELAAHPTPKPVGLIADLLRDTSRRHALVLDNFGGGGTTLMAAQRTGRRAALIEIDPLYVDATIRRWQAKTGLCAHLAATGETFAEVECRRCQSAVAAAQTKEADHVE